ncbi:MAG: hypothetical protein WAL85_15435 [Candidatus Korobacteraceae bacterium]
MENQRTAHNTKVVNLQPKTIGHQLKPSSTSGALSHPAKGLAELAKGVSLSLLLCLAVAAASPAASAQEPAGQYKAHYKTIPLKGITPEQALEQSQSGSTLPMWTTTVSSKTWFFQTNFKVQSLGAAPSSNITTNLPTYLFPVILYFLNASNQIVYTFDPTVPGPACAGGATPVTVVQQSPLFNNSGPFMWGNPAVNFGTTQYIDALQRASWYPSDKNDQSWHTMFQMVSTASLATNVPYGQWSVVNTPCGPLGLISESALASNAQGIVSYLYQNYGLGGPTSLPVVLFSNIAGYTLDKNNNIVCCTLGFHSAYSSSGAPVQVYAEAMFDQTGGYFAGSSDITPLSHEMAEAVNDPTVSNGTPDWGHVGQVSGCQGNLEVADPLTGTQYPAITLNGYTYHPQELALVPWFFDTSTGLGWYSTNGTFKSPAVACYTFNPWIPFSEAVGNDPID